MLKVVLVVEAHESYNREEALQRFSTLTCINLRQLYGT